MPMSLSRSRPRFQLMKPMTRLSRKSAKPGMGAGLKCGSVICAMTKLIPGRPSWRSAKARRPRAIDRMEIRLLERKDNPGWGREYPQYGRVDWRKAKAPRLALGRPRHAANVAWRSRNCDQRRRRNPAGETRLRFGLAFSGRRGGGGRDLRRVCYARARGGSVHRPGRAARPAWAFLQHPNLAARPRGRLRDPKLPGFGRAHARLGDPGSTFFSTSCTSGRNDSGDSSEARRDLRFRAPFRPLVTAAGP